MDLKIESQKNPGCFYETLDLIGKGGQAKVYKVLLKNPNLKRNKIQGVFAAKIIENKKLQSKSPE